MDGESNKQPTMRAYGRHLLICNHGDCCSPEQAEALHRQVAALNRTHGLNKLGNPERVKCSLVDCLGVCEGGPIVAVYPDGVWYDHVDEARLERIYAEHLLGGEIARDLVFHALYPPNQEPAYAPAVRRAAAPSAEAAADPVTNAEVAAVARESGESAQADEPAQADEEIEEQGETDTTDPFDSDVNDKLAARRAARRAAQKKGLVIVNTGTGKGKTTAALGIMTRAWGRKMKIGVLQFLKNENARYGEIKAAERMGGIDWIATGDGWTWTSRDGDETVARARHGWQLAQERIVSGSYDLLILDEFTYPLYFGWLNTDEVIAWLRANKPPMLHLIITGRYAPDALIEYADLVTEMREIKHPFAQQGIRAQAGIEY